MAKRSPSRQRRTERRAAERAAKKRERIERKMERMTARLDDTKWMGHIHVPSGDILRIPRVVPKVGSMWRCALYDARYMVREVRGDDVYGQVWYSSRFTDTIMERVRGSALLNETFEIDNEEFLVPLERVIRRIKPTSGILQTHILDFCGLEGLLDKTLLEIIIPLCKGKPPTTERYHFRPISE